MAVKTTLHESIRETMISEVQGLPLQERLPSDRQLAHRFGVALLTINKVMNSLQADGYVERVQGRGTILASREKRIRRDSSTAQSTVLLATPHYFSHQYWNRGFIAEELALKGGCRVSEFRFGGSAGFEGLLALAEQERKRGLAGVLIDPVPGSLKRDVVERLDALDVPVFIFYPCPWVSLTDNVYCIVPDWAKKGYLATTELLSAGCRRLAYVNNEPPHFDDGSLKTGVKKALYENGLRLKDLRRPKPCCEAWGSARDAGYRMAIEALKGDVDGIIFASFNGAFGGYRAIHEAGLQIPRDIGVVACSSVDDMEAYMAPPVTTVHESMRWEVAAAFDVMLNEMEPARRQILSDVTLQPRASTTRA